MKMVSVLFDLEGTLVQTVQITKQLVDEFRSGTRKELVELGIPKEILEGITSSSLMRNMAGQYANAHFSQAKKAMLKQELDQFLQMYELDWAKRSTLFPDTIHVLTTLKERGISTAVVTNTSRKAARTIFAKHGLWKHLDVVVTRDDVAELKPSPEGILRALEGLDRRDAIFVGDLPIDLEAARAAGVRSVLIDRGWSHDMSSSNAEPDHTVDSLSGILEII